MSDIRDDVATQFDEAAQDGVMRAEVLADARDTLAQLGWAEIDAEPDGERTSAAIGLVATVFYTWRKQTGSVPPLFVTMLRQIADGKVSE